MALVAEHFGGAASFEYLGSKTFDEVWFLFKLYEFQVTWKEVVSELSTDSKGNKRTLPSHDRIKGMVEARIERINGR